MALSNILKNFKCPFNEEGECKFNSNPARCKFAHLNNQNSDNQLKSIPTFICIYHLLNCCKNNKNCFSGVHISLIDLKNWNWRKNHFMDQIKKFQFSKDADHQCVICLDKIKQRLVPKNRIYGILESCSHIFCLGCLKEWRKKSNRCPMCRKLSFKYASHYTFYPDGNEKVKLFKSNKVIQEEKDTIDWNHVYIMPIVAENGDTIYQEVDVNDNDNDNDEDDFF